MSKSKTILGIVAAFFLALSLSAQHNISTPAGPVYSYSHISTLTTTLVKSGAGVLHSVVVNASGSSPCFVILYDSITPSGGQIAGVDCASAKQLNYDVSVVNGLTVVTLSTASPTANPDLTITFQ
jgi:hypothetical protein